MKLAIGIPTRNRPLDLVASILSLEKTRSHADIALRYIVGVDGDDMATHEMIERLIPRFPQSEFSISIGPRPLGLGEINNRLVAAADEDATFLLWTDRAVIITENWDYLVADAAQQFPNRLLWLDSIDLKGPAQTILPPGWLAVLPGNPYPAVAPFWFDDTAQEEIDAMVWGFPRFVVNARCAGPREEKTNRCRDLHFWIRLFGATRPQRVCDALFAAGKLGLAPRSDLSQIVAHFDARDGAFLERADELMARYGAEGTPDATYLAAKRRAEAIMADLGVAG